MVMLLTLKRLYQNLGDEFDRLLDLHDPVAGSLINKCKVLIKNHEWSEETSILTADEYYSDHEKQRKLEVRTEPSLSLPS